MIMINITGVESPQLNRVIKNNNSFWMLGVPAFLVHLCLSILFAVIDQMCPWGGTLLCHTPLLTEQLWVSTGVVSFVLTTCPFVGGKSWKFGTCVLPHSLIIFLRCPICLEMSVYSPFSCKMAKHCVDSVARSNPHTHNNKNVHCFVVSCYQKHKVLNLLRVLICNCERKHLSFVNFRESAQNTASS